MKAIQNQKVTAQKQLSSREKKHQVNLKNNSGIHFQIGLIAVLFMVFGLFQLQFDKKEYAKKIAITEISDGEIIPFNYVIEQPKVIPVKKVQPKRKKTSTHFKEVDNDTKIVKNLPIINKPVVLEKAPSVGSIYVDDVPEDVVIPVNFVQILPTFPGCEKFKTKKEKMACLNKKIAKHISRKFNSDIAADNGLTGRQKIMVMFTINTNGEIVDVKARAPHPALEKEAIKMVQSLPKMKPAKQGYKKVSVSFSQPIIFEVK